MKVEKKKVILYRQQRLRCFRWLSFTLNVVACQPFQRSHLQKLARPRSSALPLLRACMPGTLLAGDSARVENKGKYL